MLGYEPEELPRNLAPLEIIHPDDRAKAAEVARRRIEGELDAVRFRARLVRRDGAIVHCEVQGRRVLSRGRPAVLGAALDVTELEEGRAEIRRLREALLRSERLASVGELLGGVAHELANPLSAIMAQAVLLADMAPEGPIAERARKIVDAAERAGSVVRNILSVVRDQPTARRQVAVNQLVTEAVELLAYRLLMSEVEVVYTLAEDVPPVWADPHQLHQVLVNLITNAEQAMRETPRPRRLTLRTAFEPSRELVVIEVADTGPGVPEANRSRIFEAFFTTKPVGAGTGLGLSVCREILASHQGRLILVEGVGPGATFRIELPRGVPPSPAPSAPGGPAETLREKAVLVVDDDPNVLAVLAEILTHYGARVEMAVSATEALERLGQRTFDVVVTDIRMPERDGVWLYEEIRRRVPILRGRVVFLTGDTLSPDTREFLRRVGAPSLAKPFQIGQVVQAIARVLQAEPGSGETEGRAGKG
jgi:PAS domain S-box-containing protein